MYFADFLDIFKTIDFKLWVDVVARLRHSLAGQKVKEKLHKSILTANFHSGSIVR